MAETDYIARYRLRRDDLENYLKKLFADKQEEISVVVSPMT